ncbi:hypothetical protein KIW84_042913 [Lathyrus oleraceus]|uniref:Uncharacterized protein n=1 Tax=Pisum sativum TaxID=3888 RepID=A0A9D4XDS7_PEA|nr:hypothetical protein KIW84_042913 [Pisum sativum]
MIPKSPKRRPATKLETSFCSSLCMFPLLFPLVSTARCVLLQISWVTSISMPSSNCYAFNNSSRIVDFSSWTGDPFEYDEKQGSDVVVRFCKDVESRSQTGYVDFGRFDRFNYFVAGSGQYDFVQEFYNGDLMGCEQSYDKMGRTAQVYNGMTQFGFEKTHHDFSFQTSQTQVVLFTSAIASLSSLVRKPILKVLPNDGLRVKLSGSAASGKPPTTLSPTMLILDWRCEVTRNTPYEVNITIPIEGYEPIQFVLTKMCDYKQDQGGGATRGWAIFGVISCIFFVSSTIFCCGGFIYKTKVERQRGVDALPGMTYLSACLEAVSGAGQGYSRPEDSYASGETSWERPPGPSQPQASWRPTERKYGAI